MEVGRWLILMELLGVAALPLSAALFAPLRDRGYAFSKLLGLFLVTWILWWAGNFLPVGNNLVVMWMLVALGAAVGWLWRGRQTVNWAKSTIALLVIEEGLFVAAFLVWSLVRSFHPDIAGTEKPMDLMFLQTSSRSVHFPPQDLWLAGNDVNYYYFGYLLMAVAGHLAGTSPLLTFNLSLALLFALALSGTYSLGLNLIGRRRWAFLAPLFVVLLGNAHSFFVQVLNGKFPWNQPAWYWESSRVVGLTKTRVATTINEFPMFSFVLGDLHPHLLALPLVLLALTAALALAAGGSQARSGSFVAQPLRIATAGIIIGSLFATNSWDFPTYLVIGLAAVWLRWMGRREKARESAIDEVPSRESYAPAVLSSVLLVAVAFLAFLPFYLDYRSPTHGIGRVTSATPPGQFLEVFAFFGFCALSLLVLVAWEGGVLRALARTLRPSAIEAGSVNLSSLDWHDAVLYVAIIVALCAVVFFHLWVMVVAAALGAVALWLLGRLTSPPADRFSLLLTSVSALLICATELVYLRDSFDGTVFYRMNTVFKFYFQVWILLGLVAAYATCRITSSLWRSHRGYALVWTAVLAAGIIIGGSYSILGPLSYYGSPEGGRVVPHVHPLNGMESLASSDPQDYRAIRWMETHIHGNPRVLEATGSDYSTYARVSTFTGLPTLLGWEGHEQQWRGNLPIMQERRAAVDEIYSTSSIGQASDLLAGNHVSLVYVGPCERETYGRGVAGAAICPQAHAAAEKDALAKFARFMRVIYHEDGVVIYRRRSP